MPSLARLFRLRLAPALPVQSQSTALRRSGLRTKLCFVNACPRPCRVVQAFKSLAFDRLSPTSLHPSLARLFRLRLAPALPVQSQSTALRRSGLRTKLCFVNACPRPCRVVQAFKSLAFDRLSPTSLHPSLARLFRLRSAPALPSMASRSAIKKLCFLSAAPTGPHPRTARFTRFAIKGTLKWL